MNNSARLYSVVLILLIAVFSGCISKRSELQPSLESFSYRLSEVRRQLPITIRAAAAAAERTIEYPECLLNEPAYEIQQPFAEELLNRAGGLARIYPSD